MKRGLNQQEAMAYLGVPRRTFLEVWRPRLNPIRAGNSLIFDKRELDALFDQMKKEQPANTGENAGGNVWPNTKGAKPWATKTEASASKKTAPGRSTNVTKARDFTVVASEVLQKHKRG